MRPESIRRFDLFYFTWLALSTLGFILSYDAVVTRVEAESAGAGMALGAGFTVGTFAFIFVLHLLLWFLVSRKRVAIARWVIVLLFVIDLLDLPALVSGEMTLLGIVPLLALLLRAVAIFYLFQSDTRVWLAGNRGAEPAEPAESD